MQNVHALVFAALIIPTIASAQQQAQTPPPAKPMQASAGKTDTLSGESLRGYQNVQTNLAGAAEKMPEQHYGFKPTPDVKSFGQHVAHIALSQYGLCARVKSEAIRRRTKRKKRRGAKPTPWRC